MKSKLIQFRKCLLLFSAEATELPLHVQKHSDYNPQKCIFVVLLGYETFTGGNMRTVLEKIFGCVLMSHEPTQLRVLCDCATGWTTLGRVSSKSQEIFLCHKMSKQTLGPTHSPTQCTLEIVSLCTKQQGGH